MTNNYFLTATAEEDIDDIVTYIANENPASAHAFLDALFNSLDKIALNPEMGHVRDDLTDRPVKFWTFKWHYLVIYIPASPVQIIRVLSGYRDIVNLIN